MIGEEDTIPPGFLGSDRSINESRNVSTCLPIRENQSIPQNATPAHCRTSRRNVVPQQMNEYRTMNPSSAHNVQVPRVDGHRADGLTIAERDELVELRRELPVAKLDYETANAA